MSNDLNVFDLNPDDETVPVVIEIDGEKTVVGQARVYKGEDGYIYADAVLKNDDPEQVKQLFAGGLSGISIADSVTEEENQALHEFEAHDHKPIGCEVCGIDTPNWRPFGKPAGPIHH